MNTRVRFRSSEGRAGDRGADHAALVQLARKLGATGATTPDADADADADATTLDPTALARATAVGHRCAHCGGRDHGRPILLDADGDEVPGVWLSLGRAGGVVALAASVDGPIGIDIEDPAAVDRAPLDAAFTARERAAIRALRTAEQRRECTTAAWCAKEATAKLLGTGLRTPPEAIELDLPRLGLGPAHAALTLTRLEAPAPLVAVLAMSEHPRL